MAADIHDPAEVQKRLWEHLDKHATGMLGLVGGAAHHFQPMTAFLDRLDQRIWFFTYGDTDLAEAARDGHQAMFVLQHDHKFYACLGGRLSQRRDPERIERYWNAAVAAWYPQGKDDPRLTLLCLDLDDAEVWLGNAGTAKFAWEIAKANTTRSTPDLGDHTHLNFH